MKIRGPYFEEVMASEGSPQLACHACGRHIRKGEQRVVKPYGVYHYDCFFKICRRVKRHPNGEDLND